MAAYSLGLKEILEWKGIFVSVGKFSIFSLTTYRLVTSFLIFLHFFKVLRVIFIYLFIFRMLCHLYSPVTMFGPTIVTV